MSSDNYSKAYKRDCLNFLYAPAVIGDIYCKEEYRFDLKFPFIHKKLIIYRLHGEFWIEEK